MFFGIQKISFIFEDVKEVKKNNVHLEGGVDLQVVSSQRRLARENFVFSCKIGGEFPLSLVRWMVLGCTCIGFLLHTCGSCNEISSQRKSC